TLMLCPTMVACAVGISNGRNWQTLLPHALQIASLLLVSFVLLPAAGIRVPGCDARQFQILLPSVLVCLGLGLRGLAGTRVGKISVAALLAAMLTSSAIADRSYLRSFRKSREWESVQTVVSRAQPGDVTVTDCPSFSLSLAFAYYAPMIPYYRCVEEEDGSVRLSAHGPARPEDRLIDSVLVRDVDLQQVVGHPRIWVIGGTDRPVIMTALRLHHRLRDQFSLGRYQVTLLERNEPDADSRLAAARRAGCDIAGCLTAPA